MSMKKPNDTIGNQISNIPACSTVPQPTALPRAPHVSHTQLIIQGKVGYMFQLKQAIIRPIPRTIKGNYQNCKQV